VGEFKAIGLQLGYNQTKMQENNDIPKIIEHPHVAEDNSKPHFTIADFLATVVVPDPKVGRRSQNRLESLYAFYRAAAAQNGQLEAISTKEQFKQDIVAHVAGDPRFACASPDTINQSDGYAYVFNSKRGVLGRDVKDLRGFTGLRIDHAFFRAVFRDE